MKRLLLALSIIALLAIPAQGSILGDHLTFDGVEDILQDESRTNIFDPGLDGPSVGDVVYGFVSISDLNGDPSPDEIAVLISVEIIGVSSNGTLVHGPVDPTTNAGANAAFTLSSLLNPAFAPQVTVGVAPTGATVADAIAVIVSGNTVNPLGDPLDSPPNDVEMTSLAGFLPGDFSYEATVGIDPASVLLDPDGAGPLSPSGDFFHLKLINVGDILGAEASGASIFDHSFGTGAIFLPVTTTRLDNSVSSSHDIRMVDGVVFSTTSPSWQMTDQADFGLNVVPEPVSLAIWGGLIVLGLAIGSWRRRRI